MIACGLALVGKYPYGGTRHSAFLVPFALAGVAVTISALAKNRIKVGMSVALTLVALSAVFGAPHRPYMNRADQSSVHMQQAVEFIHANVKPDQAILADYQTSLLLGHYGCDQRPVVFDTSVAGFEEFRCNGLRVVATGPHVQVFSQKTFLDPALWTTLAGHFKLMPGEQVWVVEAGWDIPQEEQLRLRQNVISSRRHSARTLRSSPSRLRHKTNNGKLVSLPRENIPRGHWRPRP